MEKLLRLLNPKTVNYEVIRVDNAKSELTAQDVLLAMSFARLTPLQENLIKLKCFDANTFENINLFSKLLVGKYQDFFAAEKLNLDYHQTAIYVALMEFCKVTGDYKPSCRNRAVLAGVEYRVVHRYLGKIITSVLEDIEMEYAIAEEKVFFQLNKTNLN
ncbi:hypothetical protein [Acinetobacter junii]|uniref:hypothetical protein n=1 Tax=Acinetobacter junii TaxID=40215 RepID=UPI0009507A53|nr:hypothetical protein [Acinetobacter junii]APU48407.1 hypothetical protein BVL33_07820 [Acinetobacter junii]MDH0718324.1 hypothetical protein [Acinetobacter junii]